MLTLFDTELRVHLDPHKQQRNTEGSDEEPRGYDFQLTASRTPSPRWTTTTLIHHPYHAGLSVAPFLRRRHYSHFFTQQGGLLPVLALSVNNWRVLHN